jgi:hypothetical protein
MVVESNVYKMLVGKPEGKRPFGRPRARLEENIKFEFKESGLERVGRTGCVTAIVPRMFLVETARCVGLYCELFWIKTYLRRC